MPADRAREARFNEIFDRHFDAVRRYVWRRGPLLADDVAAKTFLVAWRRLDDVPVDELPWLIAVARNTLLNERRRSRRQTAVSDRIATEPTHKTSASDSVASGLIDAVLAAMPERDREILLLSVWEDLDREAIAQVFGCSKSNVSVRLHRAPRRFAEEMERQNPNTDSRLLQTATLTGGLDA